VSDEELAAIEGRNAVRIRQSTFATNADCAEDVPALLAEVRRLKRGEFTPDELQTLCHNLSTDDACAFVRGCHAYQTQLFGAEKLREAKEKMPTANGWGEHWQDCHD
jgi:hypothetical protein